jgi:acyl-CoA thioesterase-1
MTFASTRRLGRRQLLAALALVGAPRALLAAPAPPVVTILGDSITAGHGLPAADALPAQLQAALARLGVKALVRGAGVSGDTAAAGLARIDFSVQSDTAVCVVALGGNDLLQGIDPRVTRDDLKRILGRLKARGIRAVLCGIEAPRGLNAHFARDFNAIFPALAREERTPLLPNLLKGVASDPALNQPDGIHPNARGVAIIARNLAPVVARTLRGPR